MGDLAKNLIDVTVAKDGGVIKEIISEGIKDKKPSVGDIVSVHYVGTLTDGSQFDSSRDRADKFEFTLGKGEVIKAWDLGVASMNQGEKCILTCESNYAYGTNGSPPKIPANATLLFEIELFDFHGEDLSTKKDGGIIRKVLQEGDGGSNPNEEALVDISIVGKCNGKVFDDRKIQYSLGDGVDHNIPEGVEKALEKFTKNEKSLLTLSSQYGFGTEGNKSLGVDANATLEYVIHLTDFVKVKEVWEMDQVQKLEKAKVCKARGTEYFSKDNYKLAIKQYRKVPDLLSYDSGLTDEQKVDSSNVLKAANLNLSLCHFKESDFINARDFATKAIEIDITNVKGYFRRAKALMELKDLTEAKADFEKSIELDPKNKAVILELGFCITKLNEQKKKDAMVYKGMFDKFAKIDTMSAKKGINDDIMAGDLGEWGTKPDEHYEEDLPTDEDLNNIADIKML